MWTQKWKGCVATHDVHRILVIVTDPLVHPAFLLTHPRSQRCSIKLNEGQVECSDYVRNLSDHMSSYSACISRMKCCLGAFFLKDYGSSCKTTNRSYRSSYPQASCFTTRTLTFPLKLK